MSDRRFAHCGYYIELFTYFLRLFLNVYYLNIKKLNKELTYKKPNYNGRA